MEKLSHQEILDREGIPHGRPDGRGRYYTTCPQCSHLRQPSHRKLKCLGVTLDASGVGWNCQHCGWKDGWFLDAKRKPGSSPTGSRSSAPPKPKRTYADLRRAYGA